MSHRIRCGYCSRPFFADRSNAEYCSPSCRQRAYVRRKKLEAGMPVSVNEEFAGRDTPITVNKLKLGRRNPGLSRARFVLDGGHRPVLRSQVCPLGDRDGHEWRVCHLDDGSWIVQRRRSRNSKPWITRAIAPDPFQLDEALRLLATAGPHPRAPLDYDADRLQDFVEAEHGPARPRHGRARADRAAELV